jgi:hypothetical protein
VKFSAGPILLNLRLVLISSDESFCDRESLDNWYTLPIISLETREYVLNEFFGHDNSLEKYPVASFPHKRSNFGSVFITFLLMDINLLSKFPYLLMRGFDC